MSGSWPDGAPDDAYGQLIRIANAKNRKTFLDCSGVQFKNALNENPFTIHLNQAEAKSLFPGRSLVEAVKLLSEKCESVAITAGAEGLFYGMANRIIHAKCEVDNIYSAVGSGDCLLAGLIYASQMQLTPEESTKLAVACGAANCLREDLGMLFRTEVSRLYYEALVADIS